MNRELIDKEKLLFWLELAKKNTTYEELKMIEKIELTIKHTTFDVIMK